MTIEQLYSIYLQYPAVQTDTRALKTGDLFFALKGPNFNGNTFAHQAIAAGAAYAIVDEPVAEAHDHILLVSDVLTTLHDLARHHRQQLNIPVIAITGSNGKTTTKELVHAVLATTFVTYTTQGNLNNHIGVPLTILRIHKDAQLAVIEMGANHIGEIAGYCSYALPTHGLITNTGKAHLEGFGSIEGIRKAKGELYDHLRVHNGTAFVMWDYDYLQTMSAGIPHIITYGTHNASLTGQQGHSTTYLEVNITKGAGTGLIRTNLVGDYNLPNVLAAVTIGAHFGVPEQQIKTAIEQYTPSNSRSQLIEKESNKIILDAYNANPSSMKAAIENFANLQVPRKVLMLGGMKELGQDSIEEHQQLVNLISRHTWQQVVLVGGDFAHVSHPGFLFFDNPEAAKKWLSQQSLKETYILIKGSRGIAMEKILT